MWSVLVLFLGPAFHIDPAGKFVLTAVPAFVGSAIRLPYTYVVARFGGRNWTIISALLLLAPSIGIAILLWRIYLVNQGAPEVRTYLATDTRVDSILWGCLLAMTLNPVMDKPLATSTAVEVLVLLVSLGVLFFCFVYREGAFRETYRYTLQGWMATMVPAWVASGLAWLMALLVVAGAGSVLVTDLRAPRKKA